MIGYYNYSVILTYLSLFSALFGMSAMLRGGEHCVFVAVFCLMLSGILDMFDGAVAAKCKRSEEAKLFGIQIDSLCDLVAFGVYPAVIVLNLSECTLFARIAAVLFVLASVIRLGYFNVQESLRDRSERRSAYEGLPVTIAAISLPLMLLLGALFSFRLDILLPIYLVVTAGFEISRLPLPKPYGFGKVLLILIGVAVFVCFIIFGKGIV